MNKLLKRLKARLHIARTAIEPTMASPDELLGELFHDVQFRRVYPDCVTFVDMMPEAKLKRILETYKQTRHDPDFDLVAFVKKHFKNYIVDKAVYKTDPNQTIEEHIEALWSVLRRDAHRNAGSLVGLPHPYIVAGGRFSAQFYWDAYFIMLGLAASDHWDDIENMVKNFAFLLRKFGLIPNGNRTYLTSRSQPPFFALMVRLLASKKGKSTLVRYLPAMLAEHRFWMKSDKRLAAGVKASYDRVALMPGGEILNRYYDNKSTPRPEGYKEDVDTALQLADRPHSKVYLDIRAAAESGWDFSSRWLANNNDLVTIQTTNIVPVDLNCLLVTLEQTIADAYEVLHRKSAAKKYRDLATKRSDAITTYCWDAKKKFYFDFDFVAGERTPVVSAAGIFPLFARISTAEQARAVASTAERALLRPGGLLATNIATDQQWDSPNGWPPLQWAAIMGFRAYNLDALADTIKKRWIATVQATYTEQGKLVEKYNVVDPLKPAGGGEYILQDGFGWTNGVTLALLRDKDLSK